jgi:hypothetical protein
MKRDRASKEARPLSTAWVLNRNYLAEEVGFEPTVALRPQRFSRPSDSSTLALLRVLPTWPILLQVTRRFAWRSHSVPISYGIRP